VIEIMERLDKILNKFKKDFGLEGRLSDEELRDVAYRQMDPDLSPFIRTIWVEGNTLYIQCTEPVVVQEFSTRTDGLIRRINRDVGRAALGAVKLTLKKYGR